jgi:hypothetical protein
MVIVKMHPQKANENYSLLITISEAREIDGKNLLLVDYL